MSANNFLVKSHKFKASNVVISELEETMNGKPKLSLKYNYGNNVIGPLNIQMDEKLIKMGVTGMNNETPTPVDKFTKDTISLSFSDNEQYTDKEKYFINEINKLENKIEEKLTPLAHELFDGFSDDLDKNVLKTMVHSKLNPIIKYSTFKDEKTGKKTKKRDGKYTSMRLKLYKNEENGELYYQGLYTPYNETKPVKMTLQNHDEIIPKWCTVKTIIAIRSVWIVGTTGFGMAITNNRMNVVKLSEEYTVNDFEPDTDDEEELEEKIENLDFNDESGESEHGEKEDQSDEEEDIDDLVMKPEVPVVVKPAPKSRKTSGKK